MMSGEPGYPEPHVAHACLLDPFPGLNPRMESLLGNAHHLTTTQIEPTLHYPPVEPMPEATTGILAHTSTRHACLTWQACQEGSKPIAWAKVNTLGELVPWPGPDRCNCWINLNLRIVQKGRGLAQILPIPHHPVFPGN